MGSPHHSPHLIRRFVYWITGPEHTKLAALSMESILRIEPHAMFHVYTDAPLASFLPAQFVHVMPDLASYEPMIGNLVAQCRHVLSPAFDAPTAFIDTDILLNRKLDLHMDYDLAVTWRGAVADVEGKPGKVVASVMPYNYGVIFAKPTTGAREGFLWLRDRVRKLAPSYHEWYGNQVALNELVGPRPEVLPGKVSRKLLFTDIDVAVLDCDQWNYTPQTDDEDVSLRRVLHFKGGRKDMMRAYAARLLEDAA